MDGWMDRFFKNGIRNRATLFHEKNLMSIVLLRSAGIINSITDHYIT